MKNIIEIVDKTASLYPQKSAIISETGEISYAELVQQSKYIANYLINEWHIEPSQKIAFLLPNCAEFIILYLGVIRSGAIAVPINIRLKPPEVEYILEDSDCTAILSHNTTWNLIKRITKTLPNIKVLSVGSNQPGTTLYCALLKHSSDVTFLPKASQQDTAVVIYTSGTTGKPKGAMLTHNNLIVNAKNAIEGFVFQSQDKHLLTVPLFHVTGLNTILISSLLLGSTIVVSDRTTPRDVVELIQHHKITTYFGVPTTYILLLELDNTQKYDLSSMRVFVYSGAPMPNETIAKLRDLLPDISLVNLYGLTETTSVTTILSSEKSLSKAGSVGCAVNNIQLKVMDPGGIEVEVNTIGELWVRGESVFSGYLNKPVETQNAFSGDWFKTGDSAFIDEEGFLFLKGRKQELIIVGGENVYPIEVENIICNYPGVLDVAVTGISDPILGEVVKAHIVLERKIKVSKTEIRDHCTKNLANFKVPQVIEFIGHLPRNPSGKVMKKQLS